MLSIHLREPHNEPARRRLAATIVGRNVPTSPDRASL
jgi:hypothetical protein